MEVKSSRPLTAEEMKKLEQFVKDNRVAFDEFYPLTTELDECDYVFSMLNTKTIPSVLHEYTVDLGVRNSKYPQFLKDFLTKEFGLKFMY